MQKAVAQVDFIQRTAEHKTFASSAGAAHGKHISTAAEQTKLEDSLSERIGGRLADHSSCTVFELDLAAIWPYLDKEKLKRFDKIKRFAKDHGWSAAILDPGIRVTFRKLASVEPVPTAKGKAAAKSPV